MEIELFKSAYFHNYTARFCGLKLGRVHFRIGFLPIFNFGDVTKTREILQVRLLWLALAIKKDGIHTTKKGERK